jgi:peptide deformylase
VNVVCYPSEILSRSTPRVEKFDPSLRDLARRMFEIMYQANGVGLAGPQAGLPLRMCVMNCDPDHKPEAELVMINPEILELSGREVGEEGCLSFPGIFIEVSRAQRVKVRFQDLDGQVHTIEAEGLPARAVQHEVDHLNGSLLIHKMSVVQRLAHRRALKMLELRRPAETEALKAAEEPPPPRRTKPKDAR